MKERSSTVSRRIISLLFAAVLVLSLVCLPVTAELSGGDSLLTQSYIEKTVKPSLIQRVKDKAAAGFAGENPLIKDISANYNDYVLRLSKEGLASSMAKQAYQKLVNSQSSYLRTTGTKLTLNKGDVLTGGLGSTYVLTAGAVWIGGSGSVVNVAAGTEHTAVTMAKNQRYIQTEKTGSTLSATQDGTVLYVAGTYKVSRADAYTQENVDMAFALRQMHLMSGTPEGLKLTKQLTRGEGLIFMLNFLGVAEEASKTTGEMPFKDVPDWLRPYAAYAWQHKLVAGTSATTYKPDDAMTDYEFIALMLRILGYSDTGGKDFIWKESLAKAESLGIYTAKEKQYLDNGNFVRDKAVYSLFYLLDAKRTSGETMLSYLVTSGVTTPEEAAAARQNIARAR